MKYSNNISTNIVRDSSKDIDYVVTPNTKEIFDRIFAAVNGSCEMSFALHQHTSLAFIMAVSSVRISVMLARVASLLSCLASSTRREAETE